MNNQRMEDEAERSFNLSNSVPQNKMVSLDHILFQIEQFRRKVVGNGPTVIVVRDMLNELKEYLKEQNSA